MLEDIIISALIFLAACFVFKLKYIERYFTKNGIKYLPGYPLFGNAFKSTFLKRHVINDLDEVYKAFPEERYVGYIEMTSPVILVRDPELIKHITVKDFDHFVDHKQSFPEVIEPLFGSSIIMMKGDRWRDMRATLSPAFTGSKMRQTMQFMAEISQNVLEYLKGNSLPGEDLDVEDLIQRYTNDVIASVGFGFQVNSFKDKDNAFYKVGQSSFTLNFWRSIIYTLAPMCPALLKALRLTIIPTATTTFFNDIVKRTIEYRRKNNVERPDMIQLLIEASKAQNDNVEFPAASKQDVLEEQSKPEKVRDWSMTELTAQVFMFFAAGFDSTASTLVMLIHELTVNSDIQERLYQELLQFKETKRQLTYDNINELKYLDCVINESMRKWSIALTMDRCCTKEYELPPPSKEGKPVILKPGAIVYNMVNTIHMDPNYFPDPEKFDPDRFSDENKHKMKPSTFMPFGIGPRHCIASRFSLLEMKVLLFDILLNFKLLKAPKTSDPIVLEPAQLKIRAIGGTIIRLEARK